MKDSFSFRVYPKKGERFYFTVCIFHSKAQMKAYFASMENYGKGDDKFTAVTVPVIRYKDTLTVAPCLGEILFHRPMTGTSIVSHEMTHAALHWARVTGMDLQLNNCESASEEPLALAVGYLTRQFFMKY